MKLDCAKLTFLSLISSAKAFSHNPSSTLSVRQSFSGLAIDRSRLVCGVLSPMKITEEDAVDLENENPDVIDTKDMTSSISFPFRKNPPPVLRFRQKTWNESRRNGKKDERKASSSIPLVDTSEQIEFKNPVSKDADPLQTNNERVSQKGVLEELSTLIEDKSSQLSDDKGNDFSQYLSELSETIQAAQQRELDRQLGEIEARIVRPLEQFAFSDAAIYDGLNSDSLEADKTLLRSKLVWSGENSTLPASRRLRTKEIIKNLNVAPFYYSLALLLRWVRKVGYPPTLLLTALQSMASVVKSPSLRRKYSNSGDQYQEYLKDAELMQAGWKRTGEIAARGPLARKWAILRRSAEIWAYFSSFYMKERRFVNKFNKGKWSAERLSQERTKLGAEITQNLLKLGPTFIKVNIQKL
jgi:hypothetical protein